MELIRFNKGCSIKVEPIYDKFRVAIIDDALVDPERLVDFSVRNIDRFKTRMGNNYPGPELEMDESEAQRTYSFVASLLCDALDIGGTANPLAYSRISIATQPPGSLFWNQRMCHTDDSSCPEGQRSVAAVTYLFGNSELGGTAFYRYRDGIDYRSAALAYRRGDENSKRELAARHPYLAAAPAYLTESNEFVERIRVIPPAWNRMIVYPANAPHSPHITRPELLTRNPRKGRLTINTFMRFAAT